MEVLQGRRPLRVAENLIYSYENYKAYNDGIDDFDFKKAVEAEKKKYCENIKAKKERYIYAST